MTMLETLMLWGVPATIFWLRFVIVAFRASILLGLACLFISFVAYIYALIKIREYPLSAIILFASTAMFSVKAVSLAEQVIGSMEESGLPDVRLQEPYLEYLLFSRPHKAMAYGAIADGSWAYGYAQDQASQEQANEAALEICRAQTQSRALKRRCQVILEADEILPYADAAPAGPTAVEVEPQATKRPPSPTPEPSTGIASDPLQTPRAARQRPRAETEPAYVEVPLADAKRYTQHRAKLRLEDGRVMTGTIKQVRDNSIFFLLSTRNAEVDIQIPLDRVRSLAVGAPI